MDRERDFETLTDEEPWMPTPEQADTVDITKMPGYAAGVQAERERVLAIVDGWEDSYPDDVFAKFPARIVRHVIRKFRAAIAAPDAAAEDDGETGEGADVVFIESSPPRMVSGAEYDREQRRRAADPRGTVDDAHSDPLPGGMH